MNCQFYVLFDWTTKTGIYLNHSCQQCLLKVIKFCLKGKTSWNYLMGALVSQEKRLLDYQLINSMKTKGKIQNFLPWFCNVHNSTFYNHLDQDCLNDPSMQFENHISLRRNGNDLLFSTCV